MVDNDVRVGGEARSTARDKDVRPPVSREKLNVFSIPGMTAVFWTMALGLSSFGMLLPVVPLAVIETGGGASLAGITTAVMMAAAVATQIATPVLLRLFNYRAVISVSALLLSIPSLGLVVSMDPAMVLAVALIRGVGFGAICVALYALTAQLAPEGMLGKASGIVGVGSGAGQMVALPMGLAVTDSSFGFDGAYVLGCAMGFATFVVSLKVPNPAPKVLDESFEMNSQAPVRMVVDAHGRVVERTDTLVAHQADLDVRSDMRFADPASFTVAPKRRRRLAKVTLKPHKLSLKRPHRAAVSPRAVVRKVAHVRPGKVVTRIYRRPRPDGVIVTLVPAVVLGCCSLGYGSISSFLPAAVKETDPVAGATLAGVMLSIVSGAVMVLRLVAGAISDRLQRPGALMIPGIAMAASGVGAIVVGLMTGGTWLPIALFVLGAVLFGSGFGVIQNEAMMEMFIRMPRDKIDQASTVWNASFDAGTAVGSVILGFVAAATGFTGAFIAAGLLVAFGFVMEIGERLLTKQHER